MRSYSANVALTRSQSLRDLVPPDEPKRAQKSRASTSNSVNGEHKAAKNSTEDKPRPRTDNNTKKRKRDDSSPVQERSVKRQKQVSPMEIDEAINSTHGENDNLDKELNQTTASKRKGAKNSAKENDTNKESKSVKNNDDEFPLPNKYKVLLDVHKYVDTVFMYFKGKKNSILFEELQRQVELMTRKPVSLTHLRQIQALTPQLLNLEATLRGSVSVTVPLDVAQLSPTQRRAQLRHALLEHVTRLHAVRRDYLWQYALTRSTGLAQKDIRSQTSAHVH